MKRVIIVCACFVFLCNMRETFAYEPGTHGVLTGNAVRQSVLAVCPSSGQGCSTILQDIGLKPIADESLKFPDPQAGESIPLGPPNSASYVAPTTADILDLIVGGSELEDEGTRPLNHFYDPVSGHTGPYNINGFAPGFDASFWARNSTSCDYSQNSHDDSSFTTQCYSLQDADHYFYKALTSSGASDRDNAYGSLFTSIGHVLHLVEEMAQPQHVRNDNHCDADICEKYNSDYKKIFGSQAPLSNPSRYEYYTYYNLGKANPPINFASYPLVSLPTARNYWFTGNGEGLAEFTNSNFVSAGTNFQIGNDGNPVPNANYSNPMPLPGLGITPLSVLFGGDNEQVPQQIEAECAVIQVSCDIAFYGTDVSDALNPSLSSDNPRASSLSIFDQDLLHFNVCPNYGSQPAVIICRKPVLNRFNFEYAWPYLLPRAVAYSAGLINYFFRGRLDMQPDPNNPGGYLVINKSSYPMSNGTLTLYYDDASGNRYPVPSASWSNVNMVASGNDPADEYSIQFSAPTDPAPATPGQYMLVFQGKIGSEDGIAGKLIQLNSKKYVYLVSNEPDLTFCSSCFGAVYKFDASNFQFQSAIGYGGTQYGNEGFGLVVYNGMEYLLNDYYCTTAQILNSGDIFASSTGEFSSQSCGASAGQVGGAQIEALGINSSYLYVLKDIYTPNGNGGSVLSGVQADKYDHAGHYIATIPLDLTFPLAYGNYFSVNDSRMCLSGFDYNGNPDALLTDLTGNSVAELATDPVDGGGPCALAKDRAYILVFPPEGNAILDVYDLNGKQIASLDVSGEDHLINSGYLYELVISGVAATNTRIYLSLWYEYTSPDNPSALVFKNKIIIYDRDATYNRDGSIASENFVREPDVELQNLPDAGNSGVAVDMKDVLGGSGN